MTAKLNAYIGCFNALDSKTHGSIQSYTRWIKDVDAGPTGRETHVYGPFEISDYDMKQCDAPVTGAIAAKPALAGLDAAAGHYQQALKALVPVSRTRTTTTIARTTKTTSLPRASSCTRP